MWGTGIGHRDMGETLAAVVASMRAEARWGAGCRPESWCVASGGLGRGPRAR